jgi:hypothetical protein
MTEYKVYQNKIYGDFRVEVLINGEWENELDDNWNEKQANQVKLKLEANDANQTAFIN